MDINKAFETYIDSTWSHNNQLRNEEIEMITYGNDRELERKREYDFAPKYPAFAQITAEGLTQIQNNQKCSLIKFGMTAKQELSALSRDLHLYYCSAI